MKKPAIIVVAYNRPRSLNRILQSLSEAQYETADIPLIISIDHGDNEEVISLAKQFEWQHGTKTVVCQEKNLGLKKHILQCGDLTRQYGDIIMLEDDLYVAKTFYGYACAALEFAEGREHIAGISLYNHLFNVHARELFEAVNDGYDNWYFQFASSWGQAWSEKQWQGFRSWLEQNDGKTLTADNVPANVSGWSDKSWLKYFIKYMIDNDCYFMYPRISYTTNFFDEGTHSERAQTDFQVPLSEGIRRAFCFSDLSESEAVYDAFFENIRLKKMLGVSEEEIQIDLYGYQQTKKRYILTPKSLSYRVVKSFGCKLRPMDLNIIKQIPGDELFLYDTSIEEKAPVTDQARRLLYYYRGFKVRYMKDIIRERLKRK